MTFGTEASPPAPSLSPMAMSAYATGPHPAERSPLLLSLRSRPTVKTGSAIVVAGVLVGSLLGIGLRARREVAQAAAPATMVAKPAEPATTTPPRPYADVPFGSLVVTSPPSAPPAAPVPVVGPAMRGSPVTAPAPSTVSASAAPRPQKPPPVGSKRATKPTKAAPSDDGYTLASATPAAPKPEPKVKAPKREHPKRAAAEPKITSASDDPSKILRAAMGATENTL
jgi:hypothetical protein